MASLRNLLRKTQRVTLDVGLDSARGGPASDAGPPASNTSDTEHAERAHRLATEGRLGEALALVDEQRQATPEDAALVLARGSILFEWARYHEAIPWFQRAEALGSDNFNLYLRAGWACTWSVNPASGEPWMRKAVEVNPAEWTGHFGLAAALRGQGKVDDAIAAFERALELVPGNLHCLAQLSDCMLARKEPEAAEKYARRAIAANQAMAVAWTNLGVALVAQDRFEEGAAAFEHAERLVETSGGDSDSHLNLGICLRDTGRLEEALDLYERKLPALPSVGVNTHYAHALLTAGRLFEGWCQYEFRWLQQPLLALRPSFRKPVWAGQDLRGKTVLLRTEQGIGDVIQFIRYAPHVKALGATVLLQVRPGVGELARSFSGIDRILKPDEPYPEFDYYIHLMSLPRVFGTELASVPAAVPYLSAEPAHRERWTQRLGTGAGFKVGVVWAGDANHLRDRYRSVPLDALAPLADLEGVQFYSLQKGAATAQMQNALLGRRLVDLGPELEDFADTAAVIDRMDLLISVDTAVAHLAGALGKRTWTLIPTPAEWRWMIEREDSPWYPTMRLFRQDRHEDWANVIGRVREALGALIASERTSTAPALPTDEVTRLRTLIPVPPKERRSHGLSAAAETAVGAVQYFPDQALIGDSIGWYGEYLRPQTDLLARLIGPGTVLMEVGSGIGAHVLALAPAVGSAGHFFLYESRPLFQQVLRQNLGANGVRNVTVMKRTLTGECLPAVDAIGDAGTGNPAVSALTTPIETIDELRVDTLHWLKINEAADALQVIEGAAESLWRLRPKLFVSAATEQVASAIASRARDFGYQCWKMEVPYFDPANFNRRDADIFAGRSAIAVLAIPEEIEADIILDRCTRLA